MTIAALSWSALRPLRPVLLAGAAAVTWLAVSAPAADADNSHQAGPVGSTISSAVASVKGSAESVTGSVGALVSSTAHEAQAAAQSTPAVTPAPLPAIDPAALPEALPATVVPAPAEQPPASAPPAAAPTPSVPVDAPPVSVVAPVVADIVEPVDAALGGLPLGEALPDGPLAGATDPVGAVADGALTDAAETIVKPVLGVVEPVAEVVKPVTDAVAPVTDVLPVELPLEPVTDVLTQAPVTAPIADVVAGIVAVPERLPAADPAEFGQMPAGPVAPIAILAGPSGVSALPVQPVVGSPAHFSHPVTPKAAVPTGSAPKVPAGGDSPSGGDSTPTPDALLPAPASGSGSGTSSGGPSASAAWLNSPFEYLPLMGFVPVSGPLQHVPSPVAIDPGSSPD
ncbi:MAG TPA: hypothetical protein VJS86_11385 [Arthrobacter sp.]|nr:hypothetical protein [Arthrobacter sp.]